MAELSKLNRNNEQRLQSSSACTLQAVMPGGLALAEGEQHVIGAIPTGALIKGWTAFVGADTPWSVTVSIGTTANPTLFATALGVSSINVNDKTAPMEFFFPDGEDIVCTLTTVSGKTDESAFQFVLDYTEVNTTCGAYTA